MLPEGHLDTLWRPRYEHCDPTTGKLSDAYLSPSPPQRPTCRQTACQHCGPNHCRCETGGMQLQCTCPCMSQRILNRSTKCKQQTRVSGKGIHQSPRRLTTSGRTDEEIIANPQVSASWGGGHPPIHTQMLTRMQMQKQPAQRCNCSSGLTSIWSYINNSSTVLTS